MTSKKKSIDNLLENISELDLFDFIAQSAFFVVGFGCIFILFILLLAGLPWTSPIFIIIGLLTFLRIYSKKKFPGHSE